jgi:hypothetical protein
MLSPHMLCLLSVTDPVVTMFSNDPRTYERYDTCKNDTSVRQRFILIQQKKRSPTNEGTRRATSVLINHTKLSTSEQQMKARLQYGIAYMSGESNVQAIVKRNSED